MKQASLTLLLFALITPSFAETPQQTTDDPIAFLSPTPFQEFTTGQEVAIKLKIEASIKAKSAGIMVLLPEGGYIGLTELLAPDFQGTLKLPQSVAGVVTLLALVKDDKGKSHQTMGGQIINVKQTKQPIKMSILDRDLVFSDTNAEPQNIYVGMLYEDGTGIQARFGYLGTRYTTSDPSVALVDEDGKVTPVSRGIAFITVEHGGLKNFVEIIVYSNGAPRIPPIEHNDVSFTMTELKEAPPPGSMWGFFYEQNITITNENTLPLPKPLHLLLVGLDERISFFYGYGEDMPKTKNILPTNTPYTYLDIEESVFMSPGNTITVKLRFRSNERLPIPFKFTPKLMTFSHDHE